MGLAVTGCDSTGSSFSSSASSPSDPSLSSSPDGSAPSPSSTPTPVIIIPSPRPTQASNETICDKGTSLSGIDVSDYDPSTNWTTVQQGGKSFAFVKATEGIGFKNQYFASDWATLKTVGMVRGAYHYFHPKDDPLQQAKYFLATVGTLEASDLPAVLDFEVTDGESVETVVKSALVWLTEVESVTKKIPIVYVGPAFWNELGNPSDFIRYPLFIANYEVSCPAIPPPWSTWTFWQQGQRGVPGVQESEVDLDLFNGTQAEMESFAQTY